MGMLDYMIGQDMSKQAVHATQKGYRPADTSSPDSRISTALKAEHGAEQQDAVHRHELQNIHAFKIYTCTHMRYNGMLDFASELGAGERIIEAVSSKIRVERF